MDEVLVEPKVGTYPNLDDIVAEDGLELLLPCVVCNKTFKPEVLQRHSKVCERSNFKKRKTFDSFKQRVKGTDLAEFLPFSTIQKRQSTSEKSPSPVRVSQWKEKHEAFVSAIRAARGDIPLEKGGSGEPRSLLRPPDHERCPYCDRHFGPKAFDRHQDWCREQHSRQPPSAASIQAKERLEARIKYRAPPIRSKRALTREKYSPLIQRKAHQTSPASIASSNGSTCTSAGSTCSSRHVTTTSVHHQEPLQKLNKSGNSFCGRSQNKDSPPQGLSRGAIGRTSLRATQRQTSVPAARRFSGSVKGSSTPLHTNSATSGNLQDNGCKENISLASSSEKKSPIKFQTLKKIKTLETQRSTSQFQVNYPSQQKIKPELQSLDNDKKENWKNKSPKADQVWSGRQEEEPYDPYASAERQMLELLHSDSASDVNIGLSINSNSHKKPSPAPSISSPNISPKPTPLETSPTSAFTRYCKDLETIQSNMQTEGQSNVSGLSNDSIQGHSSPQTKELAEVPQSNMQTKLPSPSYLEGQPQPPPRLYKRSASLYACKDESGSVVSEKIPALPEVKSFISEDLLLEPNNNSHDNNFDIRPRTYDVESGSRTRESNSDHTEWVSGEEEEFVDVPVLRENANGGKSEVLQLDPTDKNHNETRESREIREITGQDSNLSGIDGLLEEVVRMQRSVSLLSEVDSSNNKPISKSPFPQPLSSARSRRNRTGKMLIEDFLFPAEMLEQANENLRSSIDPISSSSSVFGSTKSRSKSRRLLEQMLFPTGDMDINANTDLSHEDVVVSPDVCVDGSNFPVVFDTSTEKRATPLHPSSPVALTSRAMDDNDDGLPRPKPLSLSTRSPGAPSCVEPSDKEPHPVPTSPLQPPTRSRQSTGSRLSADSAYSSLNRKSPILQARHHSLGASSQEPQQQQRAHGNESPQSVLSHSFAQSLALSSSGSESSLPPLTSLPAVKRGTRSKQDRDTPSDIVSATTPLFPKLSKFCHECGTRFSVSLAKFCCECGARRLELC